MIRLTSKQLETICALDNGRGVIIEHCTHPGASVNEMRVTVVLEGGEGVLIDYVRADGQLAKSTLA